MWINTKTVPTIGRIVWYWPSPSDLKPHLMAFEMPPGADAQPMAAQIAYVHSDTLVNLSVTDHLGVLHSRTSVHLAQDDEKPIPTNIAFATWMPYQTAQHAQQAVKVEIPKTVETVMLGAAADLTLTDGKDV